MTISLHHLFIVLGSGYEIEMRERADRALSVYKEIKAGTYKEESKRVDPTEIRVVFLFTGRPIESKFLYEYCVSKYPEITCLQERESRNTIDNIYNSFGLLRQRLYWTMSYGDGHASMLEVNEIEEIHIVTSNYHLKRTRLICENLDISREFKLCFHGAIEREGKILEQRKKNEEKIANNLVPYIKLIKSYNLKFKHV